MLQDFVCGVILLAEDQLESEGYGQGILEGQRLWKILV